LNTQMPDDSIYGGVFRPGSELARRLFAGEMSPDEFSQLFEVRDERDPTLPSLGVYIVIALTHVLFVGALTQWARRVVEYVPRSANREMRMQFDSVLQQDHDFYSARQALRDAPLVQSLVVRGMLLYYGLRRCANWTKYAEDFVIGGRPAVADIILMHLREGLVDDIRLFVGADTRFGNEGMLALAGPRLQACASVCASRAPELFLYWGHKLGLDDDYLDVIYLLIRNNGGYDLSPDQRRALLSADYMRLRTRQAFARAWLMPLPQS
jgi:hypothetical protein